ncbi:hypothetical protein AC1031_007169 [Aphanomyces cochlioides]|nr:hypothetical protein AC1031_007169 [Aphanomyces cochlioides]
MMKGLPSFDFDVRQEWIDLSLADEHEDSEEKRRNWEWFQVSHAGHASPRKAPHPKHAIAAKSKPVKGKEEEFVKRMLMEHNAKLKNARLSERSSHGHHMSSHKANSARKSEERKSSLECAWHAVPQGSVTRKQSRETLGNIPEQSDVHAEENDKTATSARRKNFISPGLAASNSHQSPDPTRAQLLSKSPREDLQDMLDELKSKQPTSQALRVASSDAKQSVKRKLPREQLELQLLVQQHNDKHKRRHSNH